MRQPQRQTKHEEQYKQSFYRIEVKDGVKSPAFAYQSSDNNARRRDERPHKPMVDADLPGANALQNRKRRAEIFRPEKHPAYADENVRPKHANGFQGKIPFALDSLCKELMNAKPRAVERSPRYKRPTRAVPQTAQHHREH
jgi:hypothetical protein